MDQGGSPISLLDGNLAKKRGGTTAMRVGIYNGSVGALQIDM